MPRVVTKSEDVFLEICIPTYNRSSKLKRLLTILESELGAISVDVHIRITISNNHSSDNTQEMLQNHSFRHNILVRTNSENLGVLRNIWGLYETAKAKYIWLLSDDDIPKKGSLSKIIDALVRFEPTVLTFEFEQPIGSSARNHGNTTGIEEITDMHEAIPNILVLAKMSKYIVKAENLQTALIRVNHLKDTGYGWLAVILEIMNMSEVKKVIVYHEFLARCDEDFGNLCDGFSPQFWDDYLLLLDHEIVINNCPEYARKYKYRHYPYVVEMTYGVLTGGTNCSDLSPFREHGKEIPFHTSYFRNPFAMFQWICLRLGVPAWPVIYRISVCAREFASESKKRLFASDEEA